MILKILGTGCPKCKQLEANAISAIKSTNINCKIEKLTDINKIMDYGVMMTPALIIDEVVKSEGKVLSADEIIKLIK